MGSIGVIESTTRCLVDVEGDDINVGYKERVCRVVCRNGSMVNYVLIE